MLKKAINFLLKDKEGREHSLEDINSDYIVLYFYPKDSTPGCTIESQEFTQDLDKFRKLNISIVGISGGNEESKKKFCERYNLRIILLSDSDFSVSKKYGV